MKTLKLIKQNTNIQFLKYKKITLSISIIGSFLMSLLLVPLFYFLFNEKFSNFLDLILISIFTSFFCQLGDLFISFLKRKGLSLFYLTVEFFD